VAAPPARAALPAAKPRAAAVETPAEAPRAAAPASRTETSRTPAVAVRRPAAPPEPRQAASAEPRPATRPRAAGETKTPPVVTPAPALAAALPQAAAPLRTDASKLRVEVIVYSEDRPQRWAFISGRKYVEGDAIGDGARVEEIQSTGVVLNEDGRRLTLRP
jgi:hypothetical protein